MVGAASQRAKLLYGKDPENARRSSMMKQLHGLAEGAPATAPSPAELLASALGYSYEAAPAAMSNTTIRPGSAGALKPAMRTTPSGSGFRAATAVAPPPVAQNG